MVARRRTRLPPRRLRGEAGRRLLPVVHVLGDERLVPAGDTRGVAHQVPHLDLVLAGLAELRPVRRDLLVGVEQPAVDAHQRRQRGHRLGGRPDVDDRVLGPRRGLLGVAPAAPDVEQRLAVDVDHDARAELVAGVELLGQHVLDRLEPRVRRPWISAICSPSSPVLLRACRQQRWGARVVEACPQIRPGHCIDKLVSDKIEHMFEIDHRACGPGQHRCRAPRCDDQARAAEVGGRGGAGHA